MVRPHGHPLRPPLHLRGGAADHRNRQGRLRRRGADAQPSGTADAQNTLQARSRELPARRGQVQTRRRRQTPERLFQGAKGGQPAHRRVHAAGQQTGRRILRTSQSERPCRAAHDGLPRTRRSERGEARKIPDLRSALRLRIQGRQGTRRGQGDEQAAGTGQRTHRGERHFEPRRTCDVQGFLLDR